MKKYLCIYSLNQMAYLMLLGFHLELVSDNNKLWYGIIESSPEVIKAISKWRDPGLCVPIHEYLNMYKELRENINRKRVIPNG